MTVQSLGVQSVGSVNAGASLALAQLAGLQVGATVKLGELQARLAAALTPPTPLDPTTALQAIGSFAIGYNPALILQEVAAQIPTLTAEVGAQAAVVAAVALVIDQLTRPLQAGGIHVFKYDGAAAQLGAELGAEVAGDLSGNVQALVLVTDNPAAFAALLATMVGP